MPEQNDVLGLQFGGEITTKVWQPFSVSVYMEPKDFPKNQLKLLEQTKLLYNINQAAIYKKFIIPVGGLSRQQAEQQIYQLDH
jgi:hypothetical protein